MNASFYFVFIDDFINFLPVIGRFKHIYFRMKFYNRTNELAELKRIKNLSFIEHSRMTVLTGRRRIGKTSLLMKSVEDYNVLKRVRPLGAKEGTQTVRYEITDNFLQFWFNYFERNRSMLEIKNFVGLQNIIKADCLSLEDM